MCGIAGIFNYREKRAIDQHLLRRMTDALAHRGPDGSGYHFSPGIGLGHRRLAIIDLSSGDQPLYNEDGSVCVVFNGEIYNFQDLARDLVAKGHVLRTHCDTEVIVHAWEEWGEACLKRFNGMFAFALWDERQQSLFLARDRLGEKPLYYGHLPTGEFVFASELKSLVEHPRAQLNFDLQAVEEFFCFGYIPDPRSIFRGIRKLPPAHSLQLRYGATPGEPKPYWDISFLEDGGVAPGEVCEELISRLREAVRLRLVSDVPLGAFLSGGVDSSAVVAMMAGLKAEPVETFSISFGTAGFDESAYAQQVARRYKTTHHARRVDADSFDLLDRLPSIYDEPFGDSSAIPTFRVSAVARESVTVALSGDGGDENFAGYRRYRWHTVEEYVRRMLPAAIRQPLFTYLGGLYPKLDWAPRAFRAKATLLELARSSTAAYGLSVSVCKEPLRDQLFSSSFKRELQGYRAIEVLEAHQRRAATDDPLSMVQYLDFKTYLPGDILTKVDRASMANSLEVRVPLLDHTFVEWAARLPSALKLTRGEGKSILKRALQPHLSDDILYRPKQGFSVPLAHWFRGPLRGRLRETLLGSGLGDTGYFDMDFVLRLVSEHQSGAFDHSAPLWLLSSFGSFLRQSAASSQVDPATRFTR